MSILLLLFVGAWMGYREIGVSFLGIHIRDLISTRVIGVMFLFVVAVCILAVLAGNVTVFNTPLTITQSLIIMCAVAMAVVIVRTANQYTSVITAFWGAIAAVAYLEQGLDSFPLMAAMLSLIAAPVLGVLFYYLYEQLFDSFIYKSESHLLIKNLHMKRLALVGIIMGGLMLSINYGLFVAPFLTSVLNEIDATWASVIAMSIALLSVAMIIPATIVLRNENSMAKPMSWALPSLYSLITVLIAGNVAGTLLLGMTPVIVSPSQLRECSKMSSGSRRRSFINLLSISLATPIVAFLLAMALMTIVKYTILMSIITCFVLITCLLIILYSKQWRKHNQTKKALDDELTHNTEAGDERNRLDVAAVTSQFNVMTNEIDIKHKELVNLSLYIKQQRQYLEDLSKDLNDLASEQDVALLRQQLRATAQKLNENMRLTGEMDHFYTQVEGLHKNFVSRLFMRCPNLSEKEKRLAILLRLGFSSKDISSMMNVEPKSVEVSRYRFRRKLRLDRSVNIVQYLQMI